MKQKIKDIIEYCNDNIWGVLIAVGIIIAIGIILFNFPYFALGGVIGAMIVLYKPFINSWFADEDEDEDEDE